MTLRLSKLRLVARGGEAVPDPDADAFIAEQFAAFDALPRLEAAKQMREIGAVLSDDPSSDEFARAWAEVVEPRLRGSFPALKALETWAEQHKMTAEEALDVLVSASLKVAQLRRRIERLKAEGETP